MQRKLIATMLLGATLAAPAYAQNAGSSGTTQGMPGQGQQSSAQNQGQSGSQQRAMSQQQLRRQLEQAGFHDVKVLDAAYLVQARTQDGNTVFMMINPPGITPQASTGSSPGQSSATGSSASPSAASSGGSGKTPSQ